MGPIKRITRGLNLARAKSDTEDLQSHLDKYGNPDADRRVKHIAECQQGELVEIVGAVKILSIRPHEKSPMVEIELADSTGAIVVVWLGRRLIPGITVGRTMKVRGRLTCNENRATIFNPRYELRPIKP